jgi:YHS domain-containing protein
MKLLLVVLTVTLFSAGLASCRCEDEPRDAPAGDAASGAAPVAAQPAETGTQVECPVCGLRFGKSEATATHRHEGQTYNFLLEDHRQAFAEDPERYLGRPAPGNPTLSPDAASK